MFLVVCLFSFINKVLFYNLALIATIILSTWCEQSLFLSQVFFARVVTSNNALKIILLVKVCFIKHVKNKLQKIIYAFQPTARCRCILLVFVKFQHLTQNCGLQYSFSSFTRGWNSLVVLSWGSVRPNLSVALSKALISCVCLSMSHPKILLFGASSICCEHAWSESVQIPVTQSKK